MIIEWKNHKSELKRYIEKQVNDPNIVDDILQEIYIKVSNNLHQLQAKGSLRSWLYRLTHNVIMDHFRQHKSFEELPDNLHIEQEDPIEQNYQSLSRCIKPLLEELPDKYRIPLEYAELQGMSQQNIADKLGLSLSGAKSRVQRARKKFREKMMEHCDFEVVAGGVADFTPKTAKGRDYYKKICK
jgi:RNA polymerase sigma-70 factor (ECF subfamily)